MKIAFLTPEYPHSKTGASGGIGTSIRNLALGLISQNCEVRVLVYGQKVEGAFLDEGILIQQIRNVKIKGLSWYLTRKKLERIINDLHKAGQINLVEAPDWTGISSFIQPKCPLIIRLNGSDTYFCHLDQRPVKWFNKYNEKRALQKADGLLSVSQYTADITNTVFGLNKKFAIIPNGVDGNVFSQEATMEQNANTILYFGSLIRKKGLLELPLIFNAVLEKNPEAQLILVGKDVPDIKSGNPSTWQMMQDLFSPQALLKVNYLGEVPYSLIRQQIQKADVCVFPSFAEAFPLSWLEAMVLEKAIVASNIGWAPEMIEDAQQGFLVSPLDHLEFASKVLDLLANPELRKTLGAAASKKVQTHFSANLLVQKNISFYESILKINR